MQRHDKVLTESVKAISSNLEVIKIYLFGSCARGDESWSSDVDLLVVVKDDTSTKKIRQLSCAYMPTYMSAPELDIAVYRQSSLDKETFFLQQVKKDWMLCYENLL